MKNIMNLSFYPLEGSSKPIHFFSFKCNKIYNTKFTTLIICNYGVSATKNIHTSVN